MTELFLYNKHDIAESNIDPMFDNHGLPRNGDARVTSPPFHSAHTRATCPWFLST
jgi:hypothetical protein